MTEAKFENLEDFLKGLEQGVERMGKALDAGLYAVGNNIIAKSNEIVPKDTGALEASGYATLPKNHKVEVGYNTPYAVKQHEDTSLQHKPGEEADFLRKTMNVASGTYLQDVQAVAKTAFDNNTGAESVTSQVPTTPDKGQKQ